MNLSAEIKRERKRQKLSLSNLAQKAGLSYAMVHRLENGNVRAPKTDVLHDISKALGLDYLQVLKSFDYIDDSYIKLHRLKTTYKRIKVVALTELYLSKPTELFFIYNSLAQQTDIIVKIHVDHWYPLAQKGHFAALKKVKRFIDGAFYVLPGEVHDFKLVVAKKHKKQGMQLFYLNYDLTYCGTVKEFDFLYEVIFFSKDVKPFKSQESL